ncbi:hypothetical protein NFI96_012262 [Prochilodus magdalenae]|nr:hypothetical protein NFI96_012262 [Prochilodus magdalenae]
MARCSAYIALLLLLIGQISAGNTPSDSFCLCVFLSSVLRTQCRSWRRNWLVCWMQWRPLS